jgi:lipopolysaccharide biosynthesis glycosyltransferase
LLDQDILNHLCEGRVKYIDMSWNLMVDFGYIRRKCIISKAPSYLIEKYDNARQKPKIIHYAGPEKPWYYPEMDFAVEFWNVARKTKYYETILWNMSQHAADEVQKWHEKQIKHPVRDNIEKFRVFTLKIVPKDNKVRVALKNAVKKALKIDDKTKSKGDDWMPEIPNIYRKEI